MHYASWFASSLFFVLLAAVLYAAQAITIFFTMYQTVIGYLGLRKNAPLTLSAPEKKFAVLVAAHNEEAVVGEIVDNLKELDYPKDLYDVYVICDNCTDGTAEAVRQRGGAFAMERHDPDKKGKGYGLEWMFAHLWELEKKGTAYDAVVMFDADNLVSPNFLQIMNAKLAEGHEVVQGYLDSKNPNDTWVTKSYAFAYWTTNRTFQLSRENLGLSAQLGGTGVVVSTKVLKDIGWGATSLTEDLEFTQRYLLKTNKRIAWAHDAKTYDEKPLDMKSSWKQRIRWMQGHSDCMMRYTGPLLKEAFNKKSFKHFDSAIYLLLPSRIVLSLLLTFFTFMSLMNLYSFTRVIFTPAIFIGIIIVYYGLPFIGLLLEKKGRASLWAVTTYVFGLTWIPITLIGLVKRNQKVWSHTKHTRALSTKHIEQPKRNAS